MEVGDRVIISRIKNLGINEYYGNLSKGRKGVVAKILKQGHVDVKLDDGAEVWILAENLDKL